ncbi:MAG: hypothetical protein Q4B03_01415 [Lachnospiraceae bacterium]|nr:hypothetical protein [Lachnospiraceae bacterium]
MSEKQIFRKKSLEQISSPDRLTDYIRVQNPGAWMLLGAVTVLLIGMCVWGVFGRMESRLDTVAVSDGSGVICYVSEDVIGSVRTGQTVRIGEQEAQIQSIERSPVEADEQFNPYALHVGELQAGQWVYPVLTNADLPEGTYQAQIVTESVSSMSFIFN